MIYECIYNYATQLHPSNLFEKNRFDINMSPDFLLLRQTIQPQYFIS